MEYLNKISNLQDYTISNAAEYFEMVIYSLVCFLIPIMLSHPQLVVGVVVNCMLITAALNLKGYKLLPVIILPVVGALTAGMLFGPFTIYLLYLMPFIWIGNAILVYVFKWLKLGLKKNYLFTLVVGAGLKSGFLFLSAFVLFKLGFIPVMFLTAMGIFQLGTALAGGVAAYLVHEAKKRIV